MSWAQAPAHNVQFVWVYHTPPYRTLIQGQDEYRLDDETAVKYGAWMDFDGFEALLNASRQEAEWPSPTT
jgi:hypothetical protein